MVRKLIGTVLASVVLACGFSIGAGAQSVGCQALPPTCPASPDNSTTTTTTTTLPAVTGCEHSSNFRAPPGCPDDGSGRPNPSSVATVEPVSVAPTAVIVSPKLAG